MISQQYNTNSRPAATTDCGARPELPQQGLHIRLETVTADRGGYRRSRAHTYTVYQVWEGSTFLQTYKQRGQAERHVAGKPVVIPVMVLDEQSNRRVEKFRLWRGPDCEDFNTMKEADSAARKKRGA